MGNCCKMSVRVRTHPYFLISPSISCGHIYRACGSLDVVWKMGLNMDLVWATFAWIQNSRLPNKTGFCGSINGSRNHANLTEVGKRFFSTASRQGVLDKNENPAASKLMLITFVSNLKKGQHCWGIESPTGSLYSNLFLVPLATVFSKSIFVFRI